MVNYIPKHIKITPTGVKEAKSGTENILVTSLHILKGDNYSYERNYETPVRVNDSFDFFIYNYILIDLIIKHGVEVGGKINGCELTFIKYEKEIRLEPTYSSLYKGLLKDTEKHYKTSIKKKEPLVIGGVYTNKKGGKFIYLGKYNTYGFTSDDRGKYDDEIIFKKKKTNLFIEHYNGIPIDKLRGSFQCFRDIKRPSFTNLVKVVDLSGIDIIESIVKSEELYVKEYVERCRELSTRFPPFLRNMHVETLCLGYDEPKLHELLSQYKFRAKFE
jgi:hypothetical protein